MANGNNKNIPPKKSGNEFLRDFVRMHRELKRVGAKIAETLPEWLRDPNILADVRAAIDEEEARAEAAKQSQTDHSSPAPSPPMTEQEDLPAAPARRETVSDPQVPAETGDPPAEPPQPTSLSSAETLESTTNKATDPKQQLSPEQRRCYQALEREFPENKLPAGIPYKKLENKTGFKRDVIRRAAAIFDPAFVAARKRH